LCDLVAFDLLPDAHEDLSVLTVLTFIDGLQTHSSPPAVPGVKDEEGLSAESQTALHVLGAKINQPSERKALDPVKLVERMPSLLSERLRGRIIWLECLCRLYLP
jgi:hypothetical protein